MLHPADSGLWGVVFVMIDANQVLASGWLSVVCFFGWDFVSAGKIVSKFWLLAFGW